MRIYSTVTNYFTVVLKNTNVSFVGGMKLQGFLRIGQYISTQDCDVSPYIQHLFRKLLDKGQCICYWNKLCQLDNHCL